MIKYIKNNKFYLLGFFILALILLVNVFPKGYVFSGGDTAQFIEAKNNLRPLFYEWHGKAIIYYSVFYFLDIIGISETAQLSWYLGIFLVGSYLSFGIFSRLIFKSSDQSRFFISLFYALNFYTLFLFSGNTGFSHYPSLYIFIPILIGLFIKFLSTRNNLYGALFIISTSLGSSGFGNEAFALSLTILILFLILFLFLFKAIVLEKKLILKITIVGLGCILINSFWLLPTISRMKGGIEKLQTSEILEFNYVIRHTASPIINTVSLLHSSEEHFPYNFPYQNLTFLQKIFIALAFLPIIIVSYGFLKMKSFNKKDKNFFLVFSSLLIFMTMLTARVIEPFKITNYYIFHLWGMQTLRGFDKTGIYIPFIMAVLLLIIISRWENKKWTVGIIAVILLLPLPFYLGKIQQNLSYRFANASPENKDYRKSRLSFLVKIPDEYYKIRKIINSDREKTFIATLPHTPNDGSGISNFPKWKMYGVDITQYLYEKNMMPANDNYFPDWNFARAFNDEDNTDSQWIIKLLGMMNVKYIIYHKDAPEESVTNSQSKVRNLEERGFIKNLEDNNYFTLYEINRNYIIPYFTWQDKNIKFTTDTNKISDRLNVIKNNSHPVSYSELNPKKFEVKTENIGSDLVMSEKYSPNWKAYFVTKNGEETEIKNHYLARGYANGWTIADKNKIDIDHILVEYYPIRLMRWGIHISLATTLFLLTYLVTYYYGKNKKIEKSVK